MGFLAAYVAAIRDRREDLALTALMIAALVSVSGTAMHLIERRHQDAFGTVWDGIYWAAMTVTTVGYGDLAPVTVAGRGLAVATAVLGAGFLVVTAGILAAGFVEEMEKHRTSQPRKMGR